MFLKRLEIAGFKSFAKRTVLDFSDSGVFQQGKNIGITAIVGPNGSGKSNVADALRWVMGEQSMKHLRGKKAQDIIFAGSGKKAQLGSAQVSLVLDNSEKKIPLEFEDIVITRRIYRSGESEYLVNGTRVRLIDVVEFLAKAGVGQRSYCIINQGMADQVLNATPLERRSIIEEAAGVKEFQLKKERSERKLKSTKVNLERVKGLLIEIEPHLKLLRKQSQKAQKGEEYRVALRQRQEGLFGYLWKSFEAQQSQAKQAVDILAREMMVIQQEVDEMREKTQKEFRQTNTNDDQISKLEQLQRQQSYELSTLERRIAVEEGKLDLERERARNIRTVDVIPVGASLIKNKLTEIKQRQEELIRRIAQLEKMEEVQEIKEYAQVIVMEIHELYEGISRGRIEKKRPEEILEKQRAQNKARIDTMQKEVDELKKQREKVEKENSDLRRKIEELVQEDRENRKAALDLEDRLRRRQFELDKLKDRHNEAKIDLARVQVREEDLVSRIQTELKKDPSVLAYQGEAINVGEYEREISRLKMQLEQIGGIDETVMEEFEETQKRYDFLQQESEDLQQAMIKLKEIIKEMDKKVKEKFEETFKTINKEFNHYFRIIFNGGRAELKKVSVRMKTSGDSQAVADSEVEASDTVAAVEMDELAEDEELQQGIDIIAVPPGKKINNLGMLSGGERSLTSLALLFSIIAHNPPPFAILDEVEAALDEANSKRFSRILGELSGQTQFILITHNRQTMREAAMLYGVTMGDDGISKLLSVRIDQIGSQGEIK